MSDEQQEQEEVESDVISERMAKVIDETEAIHSETVQPHWEVVDNEDGDPTIYHLHDGNQVSATMTAREDGERVARCSDCGEEIDLGGRVPEPAQARMS